MRYTIRLLYHMLEYWVNECSIYFYWKKIIIEHLKHCNARKPWVSLQKFNSRRWLQCGCTLYSAYNCFPQWTCFISPIDNRHISTAFCCSQIWPTVKILLGFLYDQSVFGSQIMNICTNTEFYLQQFRFHYLKRRDANEVELCMSKIISRRCNEHALTRLRFVVTKLCKAFLFLVS